MLRGGGRGETIGQGCRVTVGSGKDDEDAGEGNGGGEAEGVLGYGRGGKRGCRLK